MKHAIDPKIDCVFKALLGSEENRNLLLHFLNAFLAQELAEPLVWVDILNPYNEREFLSDKLSIVDVKAKDRQERLYQIEIQLTNNAHLLTRIIYNWADIYSQQLKTGQDYSELRPTYAIWLLAENLLAGDSNYVHHYKLRDEQGLSFAQHGGIWLLELNKFNAIHIETEEQRWLRFFRDGEQLNDEALPDWMSTQEMKQAMSTLSTFSEKEREYFEYQSRQEYLRVQRAIQREQEQANLEKEQANREKEQANREKEQANREKEQANREKEQVNREKEQVNREKEQVKQELLKERQEKEASQQREADASAEIERLKALLAKNEL